MLVATLAVACAPVPDGGEGEGEGEGEGAQGDSCDSSADCAAALACVRDHADDPTAAGRCLERCEDGSCSAGHCFDLYNFGAEKTADGSAGGGFPVCAEPGAAGDICQNGDPGEDLYPSRPCDEGLTCQSGCDPNVEDCEWVSLYCL